MSLSGIVGQMRVVALMEMAVGERRVAITPESATKLVKAGHTVVIEQGAGVRAGFDDSVFTEAGAQLADRSEAIGADGVIVQVRMTGSHDVDDGLHAALTDQHILVGLADPLWNPEAMVALAGTGATVLALELVPRITRAQTMDVLSSMATISGYEAVLLAARRSPRMFPMLMTAAGTVPPARVCILGAGVAGLQAIATARRLGAVVSAYDIRPAAAEQIRSVGARSIDLEADTEQAEQAGGYARAQGADEQLRQQELLTPYLVESDVIITTAAVPGARSPLLITEAMIDSLNPGTLIVDLAAERGGNCAPSQADQEVTVRGVHILAPTDLPSGPPTDSSRLFANNIYALLDHLSAETELVLSDDDEITAAMVVARGGEVVHERVLAALANRGET